MVALRHALIAEGEMADEVTRSWTRLLIAELKVTTTCAFIGGGPAGWCWGFWEPPMLRQYCSRWTSR